jgi:hypothetical protein
MCMYKGVCMCMYACMVDKGACRDNTRTVRWCKSDGRALSNSKKMHRLDGSKTYQQAICVSLERVGSNVYDYSTLNPKP